jgi:HK97 family phage prohead protease
MLLRKTLSLNNVDLKLDGDTGKFSGYASVFGGVDSYGDTIVKGAFSDTLKSHGAPKMFFNHEWGMPIGKYTKAVEDDHGLFVEGELTNGIGLAADVRAAMKHGTLDGLSIGGYVKSGDYEEADAGRVINKWSTLMEVSPVVFPADGAARIDMASVKSIDFEALLPECKTERDIERLLRDAGLGKWEAMAIVSRAKSILVGRDAQENDDAKTTALILSRLEKIAA